MRRLQFPGIRTPALGLALALALPSPLSAFSAGSPICEVHVLPLVDMSKTIAQPPPEGWYLDPSSQVYFSDHPLRIRVRNPQGALHVRGVLLWAKGSEFAGAGQFLVPDNGRWQHIPASSNCGEWAIAHTDGLPKPQSLLEFDWVGGDSPSAAFRAFIIQDCAGPPGGCRDQQGLTAVLALERGIFRGGFEAD